MVERYNCYSSRSTPIYAIKIQPTLSKQQNQRSKKSTSKAENLALIKMQGARETHYWGIRSIWGGWIINIIFKSRGKICQNIQSLKHQIRWFTRT